MTNLKINSKNITLWIINHEAQLAWFVYTDVKTNNDQRRKQIKNLLDYCAKDTLALYYLIKFLMNKSNEQS